jgi:hypothetical protein
MKAGECLHKQAYRIGGRTAKCPECKCIILPNGDAVPDEKPSMAHKFLWDALDTPSRETIIDKLNCWDYILEAMEEYRQQPRQEEEKPTDLKDELLKYENWCDSLFPNMTVPQGEEKAKIDLIDEYLKTR